ncbi:hypothetical protein CH063_09097, partial [Colletotrichum higginsianum]
TRAFPACPLTKYNRERPLGPRVSVGPARRGVPNDLPRPDADDLTCIFGSSICLTTPLTIMAVYCCCILPRRRVVPTSTSIDDFCASVYGCNTHYTRRISLTARTPETLSPPNKTNIGFGRSCALAVA